MEEIWKDIKGYEGLYMISSYGRVKSLNYHGAGAEKVLKAINDSTGHLCINITKNGKQKQFEIHRLVAQHFIPNSENKQIVHHIDHNPYNNKVDNLMWCTPPEHASCHPERYKVAGKKPKLTNQYTLSGDFVKQWMSVADAARTLNYDRSYLINCCNGKHKSAYGYIWRYA